MNYALLIIPALSTLAGWLTIQLAIKLLFHPRQPKKVAGMLLQGIIPRYQPKIADQAGKLAAAEFNAFEGIEKKINDPANFEKVRPLIEEHIDDFLRNKLKEQMPMISMFIGDKTIVSLKTVFIKEIESLFPQVLGQFAGNLGKEINIGQLVSAKIAAIHPEKIETLLYGGMKKAFRTAALFGAGIGLLTGIIQLLVVILAN